MKTENGDKLHSLIRAAGLVTGLVILQQLAAYGLFGHMLDWSAVPGSVLANFGIVAAWYWFKSPEKKIPMFAIAIAAVFFAIFIRVMLVYLGVFRAVAPPVIAFVEKLLTFVAAFVATPQFLPTLIAALIMLLLMPKARDVYRRIISNGRF